MFLTLFIGFIGIAHAQVAPECFSVEMVATPEEVAPEISAVTFTRSGDLVACFRRGYIYIRDADSLEWRQFASGLHTPLGIMEADEPGAFYVIHLPELTYVADTDGDGTADVYRTVCDDWGLSGNYHEFIYGPARDAEGNFYVGLGSASFGNREEPKPPVRGELITGTRVSEEPRDDYVNRTGHYAPVPYRGWVVKITPEGELVPYASGFRQPNGVGFNEAGELFAVDNQGDWVGTSPLYHVTEGGFYGHPGSLVWHPDIDVAPVDLKIDTLREMRTPPAVNFIQNDMAGSVADPQLIKAGGGFAPYQGQMIVADWTDGRIVRAALEEVQGVYQGASFIMFEGNGLRSGTHRMAFAPDGSLYVAQTSRGWGPTEGLQRITWTDEPCMDIVEMSLTPDGFELTFTQPVDAAAAADPSNYSFVHYYYHYHADYGSEKVDVTPVNVESVTVSEDGLSARVRLSEVKAGRVYELRPRNLKSRDGVVLYTRLAAYTVNRLQE
jgi:glucose/arabinose dehydrogenase